MKTATFTFSNASKKPGDEDLVVEVNYNGDILSASTYSPILDCWIPCLEDVLSSKIWCKRIDEKFGEHDWASGHDDNNVKDYLENLRYELKPKGNAG